ncbi:hypothetical protein [Vibrio splendidus]|uniref:hypothetical protein n=1 Tax=Vibrio splendidus TaxID=29497 RepID=UPI000D3CE08D|nr:hypothetical protein [Vibrio splendidus]PTO81221.1 hypothetical protein CWN93_14875 [Vibrio splendidus]
MQTQQELCTCNEHDECDGSITIKQCSSIKLSKTMGELCGCGVCDGTISKRACINKRSSIKTEIHKFVNFHDRSKTFEGTQSEFTEFLGVECGEISTLINKENKFHVRGWCLESKIPESIKQDGIARTLHHKEYEPISDSMPELAKYIHKLHNTKAVIDISPLFRPDHSLMTFHGWYCPIKNPDGVGGRPLAASKNRWWQPKRYHSKEVLNAWKHIELLYDLWAHYPYNTRTKLDRLVNNPSIEFFEWQQNYKILQKCGMTPKRAHKLIELFNDEEQYQEMLELHAKTDFDALIENCEK